MTNVIKGRQQSVLRCCSETQLKEYRTLYFKDNKNGRTEMQAEMDRLSRYGWQLSNTQAIDQGYGIGGSVLLGLAGKRKSQVMIVMERERGGNYPAEPVTPQSARDARREQSEAVKAVLDDRAERFINKIIPGYSEFRKKYRR